MGHCVSKLCEVFSAFSVSHTKILMLGLDTTGKTTLLHRFKLNENVTTVPTIGFNIETVSPTKGVTFTVWDVGQQIKRRLIHHYFKNTGGLIYVVDSNDRERLQESKDELEAILKHEDMIDVPVVVIANKQDLPGAMSTYEVADGLGLNKIQKREWFIQGACAVTGDGVYESMEKMADFVKNNKKR